MLQTLVEQLFLPIDGFEKVAAFFKILNQHGMLIWNFCILKCQMFLHGNFVKCWVVLDIGNLINVGEIIVCNVL